MKTEKKHERDTKALRDVWEWKDSIYQDVKDLPLPDALHAIMDMARKESEKATYVKRGHSPASKLRVAEQNTEYKKGKRIIRNK